MLLAMLSLQRIGEGGPSFQWLNNKRIEEGGLEFAMAKTTSELKRGVLDSLLINETSKQKHWWLGM